MLDHIVSDIRLALREWKLRTALALTVITILALATGLTTATYTLLDWTVLRSLPYPDAHHIFSIGFPQYAEGDPRPLASIRDYRIVQLAPAIDKCAISRWSSMTLVSAGEADQVNTEMVSPSFLSLFDARLALGRPFATSDFSGTVPVAILSFDTWKRQFSRETTLLGKTVQLNSQPVQVIGVLSRDFHDPLEYRRHEPIDVFLPLLTAGKDERERVYYIQAHIRAGADPRSIKAEIDTKTASDALADQTNLQPPARAEIMELQRSLNGTFRLQLLLLTAAVALLLLIACANVAGLLLARNVSLEGDIAIRLALGATPRRIVQQRVTDMVLLSGVAAILGLGLAGVILRLIIRLIPVELPRSGEVQLDFRIVLFAAGAALFTALACSAWPAIRAAKLRISQGSRSTAGLSADAGRHRFSFWFVMLQISLSLVLLAGNLVLIRSYRKLSNVDPGFAPDQVLTVHVRLPRYGYRNPDDRSAFYRKAVQSLSSIPGVRSAAMVASVPLGGSGFSESFMIQGRPLHTNTGLPQADWNLVSPEYFRVMQIPLIEGRFPTDQDVSKSKEIVVVNRFVADHYWHNQNAVGQRVRFGSAQESGPWVQIIGVVGDIKDEGPGSATEAQVYQLYTVLPPPSGYFVIRSQKDPASLGQSIRSTLRTVDRGVPVEKLRTMQNLLDDALAAPRFRTVLLSIYSFFALILSALGTYGAISYSVAQRKHEFGVRMALGATPRSIAGGVFILTGKILSAAIVLGLAGGVSFMIALRSLVFSIAPVDPLALLGSVLVLVVVGLAAAVIPARRAAQLDPANALRGE